MKMVDSRKYFKKKADVLRFFIKNASKYQEAALDIQEFILFDRALEYPVSCMPAVINQILSKFRVLDKENDIYYEMLRLLEEYSFLDGDCCEVGAGIYPRLAEVVAPTLHMKKKSLTIYDSLISFSISNTNVVVKKEDFTKKTDIRKFDTLYGMYPCEATIPLVEKALEEDKNLLVALCSCNDHATSKYPRGNGIYWAHDFCNYIARDYGDEVTITNWYNGFDNGLPIMIRENNKYKEKRLSKKS